MDTFVVQKTGWTSWLHKLASFVGWRATRDGQATDFCYWVRKVMLGAIVWLLMLLVIVAIWGIIGVGIYGDLITKFAEWGWNVYPFFVGVLAFFSVPLLIVFAILVLLALFFTVYGIQWLVKWNRRRRAALPGGHEPSQFQKAYKAVKNRYCIRMEIK